MDDVLAVILGGGRGARLFPLTELRSKPAVPFAGKYRLIDVPVSNCLNSELRRIFVLTQFNSESLNKHLSTTYNFDAFSGGFVSLLAAEQRVDSPEWFQGTADAVRQSFHHLQNHRFDDVIILSGDQLYQMDYRKLVEKHRRERADITVAVQSVSAEQTSGFGILKVNQQGRIVHFEEKPEADRLPDLVSPLEDGGEGLPRFAGYLRLHPRRAREVPGRRLAARLRQARDPRGGPEAARAELRSHRLLGGRRDDPLLLRGSPRPVPADAGLRSVRGRPTRLYARALPAGHQGRGLSHPGVARFRRVHPDRSRDREQRDRHPEPRRPRVRACATAC